MTTAYYIGSQKGKFGTAASHANTQAINKATSATSEQYLDCIDNATTLIQRKAPYRLVQPKYKDLLTPARNSNDEYANDESIALFLKSRTNKGLPITTEEVEAIGHVVNSPRNYRRSRRCL